MKNFLFIVLSIFSSALFAQDFVGHKIELNVENSVNDTIIVGHYYADRQLAKDTLIGINGKFEMKGEEALVPGMYLFIFKPKNDFVQVMIPTNDQEFKVNIDASDLTNARFKGSLDNEIFVEYVTFIREQNAAATRINEQKITGKTDEDIGKELSVINDVVIAFQNKILNEYPNSLTARLIKSGKEVKIPGFEGTENEKNTQRYLYYKKHYYDYIDLGDSVNLRMPYLDQKVKGYMEKLTPQHPDSIILSIDRILTMMEPAPETFRFYVSQFLNKYASSRIVGMDAVYVFLVDKYYSTGKTPWVNEETLLKIKDNARMLKPTLIGKKSQDVVTFREDGSPISLHSLTSDYTLLYIYAYDCGHCKKSTPFLVDFYEKFKDRGVSVFTICTKPATDKCWEYTKEKKMDGFINTVDPTNFSRFRTKFDVRQTPKIFILDKNKKILIKNFPAEEIEKIMDEIIKLEENKS